MGVGNLKKQDKASHASSSPEAEAFIQGAKVDGQRAAKTSGNRKPKVWKSVMFSLDNEISDEITRLSLLPRTVKRSRSDVIRVAVGLLAEQGDEQAKILLESMDDNS